MPISFKILRKLFKRFSISREIPFEKLYISVYDQLYSTFDSYVWIIDFYIKESDNSIFAVVSNSGYLYRVAVSMEDEEITLGEPEKIDLSSTARSSFFISRQKDGSVRWFGIAATSVLNRTAQIDSTQLFDNFIKRADKSGYPYLTYLHIQEEGLMGTVDYLVREEKTLLASGVLAENIFTEALLRTFESGSVDWGLSISFRELAEPESLEVISGISIPVYTDGTLVEISVLAEEIACSLFTNLRVQEVQNMDERTKKELLRLAEDDEELAQKFVDAVDGVNRQIKEEDLISREADGSETVADTSEDDEEQEDQEDQEETSTDQEDPTDENTEMSDREEENDEEDTSDREFVLDESAISAISNAIVKGGHLDGLVDSVQEAVTEIVQTVETIQTDYNEKYRTQFDQIRNLQASVSELVKEDTEKHEDWSNDLSRNDQRTRFIFRPSEQEETPDGEPSFSEIAEETASNIIRGY